MPRVLDTIGTLTIANGATDSNVITTKLGFGTSTDIIVYVPTTLTGTVTLQVSYLEAPTTEWYTLNIGGTDVTLTAAKAIVVPTSSFRAIRAHSSAAEGGARSFPVVSQSDV